MKKKKFNWRFWLGVFGVLAVISGLSKFDFSVILVGLLFTAYGFYPLYKKKEIRQTPPPFNKQTVKTDSDGLQYSKEPNNYGCVIQEYSPEEKEYKMSISGYYYHLDELNKLITKNKRWKDKPNLGEQIYKYNRKTYLADLIPEPTNPYDDKAVRIEIDGHFIGFVPHVEPGVKLLLKEGRIKRVNVYLFGGPKKIADIDGNETVIDDHIAAVAYVHYC